MTEKVTKHVEIDQCLFLKICPIYKAFGPCLLTGDGTRFCKMSLYKP